MQQAMAAYQAGRAAEAGEICSRILEADPKHLDAINVSGALCVQRGDLEGARRFFERGVDAAPSSPEARNNLGVVLQQLGRWDEALASFERALKIAPGYADAWFNRAVVLGELARWDEALQSYRRMIALQPGNARAFNNCGNVLQKLRRWAEALECYGAALALRPDYVEALNNRGAVLRELKRWDEALASYDGALQLKPGYAEALNNRAIALKETNRWTEAVQSAGLALAARPGYAEALNTLGFALHDLRRWDEALRSYERAIELKPDYAEPRWNMALLHLLRGEYREGWELFEWRWRTQDIAPQARDFPRPLWLGKEPLAGRTILLHAEQGLGDIIQFSRYVAPVIDLAARVIFEVPAPLLKLMATSFPRAEVIARNDPKPDFDVHCPLASLPLAFGTTLASIPGGAAYLDPSVAVEERWRATLGPQSRPRIGIAWAGNPAQRNNHNRSMAFSRLLPLFDLDVEIHCLQKDIPESDRGALAQCARLKMWGDELRDFADTAGLIRALDVVVSVDTSVAHLSGALGQATWIPLTYAADYRYLLERDDSPWYPSARLFRQESPGDWDRVVARIGNELRARFALSAARPRG
jgi:tetratricopeptide (TPR) repeat protein